MNNRTQILYLLFILLGSILVSIIFNPLHLIINKEDRPFLKYPEPTFFQLTSYDLTEIKRPKPDEIKQFRNGSQRVGFYNINFDPDKLNVMKFKTIKPVNFGAHTASKSSPMDSKNFIIMAGDYGLIQILNKKDLSLHWSIDLVDSGMGIHNTPITFDDFMFVGDYSGRLYFMDLKTKSLIWVIDLGGALGATPYFDGHFIYANVELSSKANGYIVKIEPFQKKILWMSNLIGQQSHSSPAFDGESLYFGDNDGDFYRLSEKDGSVIWKKFLGKEIKSSPVLFQDSVIFSSWDKIIYSLEKMTGRVNWVYTLPKTNQSSVAIDVQKSVGVINSHLGLHKFNLVDGKSLKVVNMPMSTGATKASPVILQFQNKKRVFTSCKQSMLCIFDLETLNLIKEIQLDYEFSNQIGVFDKSLMVVSDRGQSVLFLDSQNETIK